MAKGKRAVALFEVIHKDKRFDRKSPEIQPGRPPAGPPNSADAHAVSAHSKPEPASQELAEQAVELWRKRHSDPETWKFPKVKLPGAKSSIAKIAKSVSEKFAAMRAALIGVSSRTSATGRFAWAWILRQNSVACGAAAAILVIGVLTLARHFHHSAAGPQSVEQVLENGPAHPSVLTVPSIASASAGNQSLSPELQVDEQQANAQQAGARETPAPIVNNLAQPGARIVNMHYVLMQSYFEEKTADEARDFLIAHSIPCTIERGVKGWRPDFYQVIGLQGFPRAGGDQFRSYIHQIQTLGVQFSPKSKYKRFDPEAIKW